MKRFICIVGLIILACPAWPARKITVAELADMFKSMREKGKSDAEIADALKQVEVSEQLTRSAMNTLASYGPGSLTTEQVYVLEARSAVLAPPAADIPTTPAPDAATQKIILDKGLEYASKTYAQLPELTATKTTLRFQDNMEVAPASSGMNGIAKDVLMGSGFVSPSQFVHYINSTESAYAIDHGLEKLPEDRTRWGENKMIALEEPDPSLGRVFQEAEAVGNPRWLRWEDINGKTAAVFAFQVPKKKSHMNVRVCCSPEVGPAGVEVFSSPAPATLEGEARDARSNFATPGWHPYKSNGVPYHGEFFIDPDTGIVVRMIIEAEFKSSDVVHQLDTRVDYAPVQVGEKTLVLPLKTVINTEVAANGNSQAAGRYSTRCTLFTITHKNYQLAGAAAEK